MERYIFEHLPPILDRVLLHGFKIFYDAPFDLNIIGERSIPGKDNQFDDLINVVYKDELGRWIQEVFEATTDPGRYWLTKPDYKPCAIMVHPQQARGAYKIGLHRGSYNCLKQWRPVKLWRDSNMDEHADYTAPDGTDLPITRELVGINIHRSTTKKAGSYYVNKWSAGCQVFKYPQDFERFMELARLQIEMCDYHTFTYTLIPREQ